jgi:hypothetical protein
MSCELPTALMSTDRHSAMGHAYRNAAIWAVGNGLVSTTLVSYLARQLRADSVVISWIIAAPYIVGVLRVFAPALASSLGDRKRFCISMYAASGLVLLALPIVCAPGVLRNTESSLMALIVLWCGYHLLEYLATVALWTWLGDLVPPRIRGRFIGRRERALTLARIAGLLASGQIADRWKATHETDSTTHWIGYAIAAALGATMLIAAVVPLARMPNVRLITAKYPALRGNLWSPFAPLFDRRYRAFMVFGCWFSFTNGLAQAPQFLFQESVLALSITSVLTMQTVMRLGQSAVSPALGRIADRGHGVPMMMASEFIVALSTLFFYVAARGSTWWFAGTYLAWIAYAGLNVGLPRLMLNLAPSGDGKDSRGGPNASHVAAYLAATGVVFALGSLLGGHLFKELAAAPAWLARSPGVADRYDLFFVGAFLARLFGVVLMACIQETRRPRSPHSS